MRIIGYFRTSTVHKEKSVRLRKTCFTKMLIEANEIDPKDFQRWVFYPGMGFNSPDKWWGDLGRRDFPHEGVDFCLYENLSGKTLQIGHQTRIPAIHDGVVKHIFPDYLGQAVVFEHATTNNEKSKIISIYAHTIPVKHIMAGVFVKQGDIIATIADTCRSKAPILPHLHYTLCQASVDIDYGRFVWNDMRNPGKVILLNPLGVIDWPYQGMETR
jgi:murein DD-endopeptidase MepM/ murein hydrolase activator NlpD